jgi:hypothetical protein
MTTTVSPTLVLDVFPAAPAEFRQRIKGRAMGARLPGGVLLEDSRHGATYQLETEGHWSMAQIAGEWHFSHAEGHIVVVGEHGVTLRPAGAN